VTPSVAAPGDTNLCDTTASMHRAVTNIEIGLFIEIFHHSKKHNYKPVGDEAGAANSAGQLKRQPIKVTPSVLLSVPDQVHAANVGVL